VAFTNRAVELTVGTHRIESTSDSQIAIVWVGP
jgi:hypothetical protein